MAARSIWDLLQGQFSPGVPAVNNFVEGLLTPRQPTPDAGEVVYKTKNPLTDITKGDLSRAEDVGMAFSGGGLSTRPTKAIGGYRAQNTLDTIQNNAPSETVGTHFTTIPNVAAKEAAVGLPEGPLANLRPLHTEPVVADIKNYMRYPREPSNWKDEWDVAGFMRMGEEMGMKLPFPKSVLSGLESAAKQTGGLEKNMIPLLKEKGYDAIKYASSDLGDARLPLGKLNSFMTFDPGQVKSRFSPEGQELIKSRGIVEPPKGLLFDDATKLWNSLSEHMKNSVADARINGIDQLPMAERKEMVKLLTRLHGLK